MSREVLQLALEALENAKPILIGLQTIGIKAGATSQAMRLGEQFIQDRAITAIEAALAEPEQPEQNLSCKSTQARLASSWGYVKEQPEQEPVAPPIKLKVTLEDRPVDVELAQYKRMFNEACADLGSINEALGLDPDAGGAEPILSAIEELKAQPEQEPVAWPCQIEEADFEQDTVTLKMLTLDYTVSDGRHWLCTSPPQRQPEPYDQQALEPCEACGWKAVIPGEPCFMCTKKQQPLTTEQIKRFKPVSADMDSFRAGVRAVELFLDTKATS